MKKLIATSLSTALLIASPFAFAGTTTMHAGARAAHGNAAVHATRANAASRPAATHTAPAPRAASRAHARR